MKKIVKFAVGTAVAGLLASGAYAQDTVKVGLVISMTGSQASTGKQIKAAVDLYMKEHGDTVAGKKVQVILRDTGSVPDNAKRLAQELIVNDKVNVVAGFEVTPAALAVAPLSAEAKVAQVVMAAGTSIITEKSPYIARTSFTLPQSSVIVADWAAEEQHQEGRDHRVRLCAGRRCREMVRRHLQEGWRRGRGDRSRSPLANPDFAPFLQRAADAKPDAIFVFVPSGQGAAFMKQFAERGLDKAGVKMIGPGDVTDDDLLPQMGDAVLGTVTAHMYSADHDSAMNKKYVAEFTKANGFRPNFMSVGGYDGMHLIYAALQKTGGKADGDSLIAAMKGMKWESPRGPISIDAETRDIVQNIYMRKVEKKNGQLYNVEFETFKDVKDPAKLKK